MLTKILICIPTYNESSTIIEIVDRWRTVAADIVTADIHLLVIDDNSPDKTADLVEKAKYPEVSILRREKKEGLGPAYISGFNGVLSEIMIILLNAMQMGAINLRSFLDFSRLAME